MVVLLCESNSFISLFYNWCHYGCCWCSPVCTVQVSLQGQTSPAAPSVSVTASRVLQDPSGTPKLSATSGLQNNPAAWHQNFLVWGICSVRTFPMSVCASVKLMSLFLGAITPSLLLAGQLSVKLFSWSWPSCWPPGIWRTWGSEGSSLSPSGCRFSLGPAQNRTALDDPCSPWWWLWSGGQDSPSGGQERWLLTRHRYSR